MRTADGYIVSKCLDGDAAAFAFLVDKYRSAVYALAYSKLRDFRDAEDVAQEAFLKAYKSLPSLRRWDSFHAWLYAITANLCRDWIRARGRRLDSEFIEDQDPRSLEEPSIESHRDELMHESVREALDSLPEIYRQALTLHYLGGMTTKEIAVFVGTSPAAVRKRLSNARLMLKEEMLAMIDSTCESQQLPATFTFRVVEIAKTIRIRPLPRISWLPLGVSAVTGIIIFALSFLSPMASLDSVYMEPTLLPREHEEPLPSPLGIDGSSHPYAGSSEELAYTEIPITLNMPSAGDDGPGMTNSPVGNTTEPSLIAAAPETVAATREQIIISGKVMADGSPVPDARVYVHETNAYTSEGGIVAEGETQADGSFQLEIPGRDDREWRSAALTLVAQHPQHSFGWSGLSKGNTADLVIELSQPSTIAGTITDQADNPIQGADIRIYWLSRVEAGQQSGSGIFGGALSGIMANTDSDGKFVLRSLPENSRMNLDALAPGYARESISGIQAGAAGLTFRLKREARIAGRVTFGKKGEPAKGIKVSCQGLDATVGWAEAYTNENGDYALTNLSAGTYNVGLAKMIPDWTAAAEEFVYAVEGQITKDVNLTLVKGGFIEGRVTEEDTHKPISTHWIGFHDAARPESQAAIFSVETDENGFYRFRAAPGKALVYSFPPEGYEYSSEAKHHVDVVEGGTLSVDFRFRKSEAVTLTGIALTFDGEPVVGAVITDREEDFRQYGRTDSSGGFSIPGLKPGQQVLIKATHQDLQLMGNAQVEAQPGTEVEILMERYEMMSVSGRVVDQQGQPIPWANVLLSTWDAEAGHGSGTTIGWTDSSGEYRTSGVIIGGEYSASAQADGYKEGKTKHFTLTPEMSTLPDIILIPARFFLEGVVTDTDGKPVADAQVIARSDYRMTSTNANGRYRLDKLPFAVEVDVSINHREYGESIKNYVPTNQTQNFVIARADGYLAGRVVDAEGNPVKEAWIYISDADIAPEETLGHVNMGANANAQGEFRLEHLLVGEKPSIVAEVFEERIYRVFRDVEMNRDDAVLVLKEGANQPAPPTPEQMAWREYARAAQKRLEELIGKPAMELEVASWLCGEPVTLSELRGKVIALHFWSGQNAAEVEKIRFVNALQQAYGDRGLVCIGIHESIADLDDIMDLTAEKGITYRIAIDKESPIESAKGVTFHKYAVAWFPNNIVLINRSGVIHSNTQRDQEIEEAIQKLLSD